MGTKQLHVVFVCTNNYCRSPMAALMFAHQIRERGLAGQVQVSSAGTFDDPRWGTRHVGGPIAAGAGAVLRSHGYPTGHCAARLTAEQLAADLVVAMAQSHVDKLVRAGVAVDRIRLMRSFDPATPAELDVADP